MSSPERSIGVGRGSSASVSAQEEDASYEQRTVPCPEPLVGAFDLGSNSFHLLVVRAKADRSFDILLSEKEMLRLGEEVGRTGRFSADAITRAIEVLAEFKAKASNVGCDEFVACATAAFREAENGDEMVEAIENATGLRVQVISGHREAQLIFLAVRSSTHIGLAPIVSADLGGGSLEISVGDQRQQYFGTSLRLGVGRLMSKFPHHDPLTPEEHATIRQYIQDALKPVMTRAIDFAPGALVVSSGSFNSLLKLAEYEREAKSEGLREGRTSLSAKEVLAVEAIVSKQGAEDRLKHAAIDAKRNDQLPIAFIVLKELLDSLPVQEVSSSQWALREGIVLDALSRREDFEFSYGVEELRIGSARSVASKFLSDTSHVFCVAEHCDRLVRDLGDCLGLDHTEAEVLSCAAILHDIGEAISQDNHDKHSAYIVEAGKLRGFTKEEIAMLSTLVRYHKRGVPKYTEHPSVRLLSARGKKILSPLLGLLRIADALDRSHQGYVKEVRSTVAGRELILELEVDGDVALEIFGLRKKAQLLESWLGVGLQIKVKKWRTANFYREA